MTESITVTAADRVSHFSARLAFETDPSDVHADLEAGVPFVLVDVRGAAAWDQGRARGAAHTVADGTGRGRGIRTRMAGGAGP